jgi:GNAT superfamily N-acetyltransferase
MAGIHGVVRRASSDDVVDVLEFDRAVPIGHERGPLLTDRVISGEVILYEREGLLSGYAVIRPRSFFGRDFVELLTVATSERRTGLGSVLLREAVATSSTRRIFTSTNRSNIPMIRLLEKENWQFSGELEGIDEGDPERIYFKDAD